MAPISSDRDRKELKGGGPETDKYKKKPSDGSRSSRARRDKRDNEHRGNAEGIRSESQLSPSFEWVCNKCLNGADADNEGEACPCGTSN